MQTLAELQDTPLSSLKVPPAGLGVGWITQLGGGAARPTTTAVIESAPASTAAAMTVRPLIELSSLTPEVARVSCTRPSLEPYRPPGTRSSLNGETEALVPSGGKGGIRTLEGALHPLPA